jgi:hypothetical protein
MFFSMRQPRRPALIVCLLLLTGLLCAACSSGAPQVPPTPLRVYATPKPTPPPGAPGCRPPSPQDISNLGFPEAQGTTPAMDLWALFLGGLPRAGQEGQIIWRLGTSFGEPVQVVALGPRGEHLRPLVLEKHTASSWLRPGAEWGTIFTFPSAGCWDLHVKGGQTVGDVWIVIS